MPNKIATMPKRPKIHKQSTLLSVCQEGEEWLTITTTSRWMTKPEYNKLNDRILALLEKEFPDAMIEAF